MPFLFNLNKAFANQIPYNTISLGKIFAFSMASCGKWNAFGENRKI